LAQEPADLGQHRVTWAVAHPAALLLAVDQVPFEGIHPARAVKVRIVTGVRTAIVQAC
jgi:hypothetical protein